MQLKNFLYKLFFLIFFLLFYNNYVFARRINTKYYLDSYKDQTNIQKFIFSKKKECFSFVHLKKRIFLQPVKIIIRNNNLIGFFHKNKFKIFYIVKSKDTLYSISKKYDHTYHELSKFNSIKKPYKIIVGQKIWIGDLLFNTNQNNYFITYLGQNNKKKIMHINAFFKNYIKCHLIASKICFFCTQEKKENKQQDVNTKSFVFSNSFYWPVKNMIFKYFNQTQLNNKNIKIVGIKGQSIFSISSGEVVCVTDMFKQYGKLIIIKHGLNYLSIYGFNDSVLVKEGDKIHAQQKIATMGVSSEKNIVQLYFEIRYKGESINPFYILPKISRLK